MKPKKLHFKGKLSNIQQAQNIFPITILIIRSRIFLERMNRISLINFSTQIEIFTDIYRTANQIKDFTTNKDNKSFILTAKLINSKIKVITRSFFSFLAVKELTLCLHEKSYKPKIQIQPVI